MAQIKKKADPVRAAAIEILGLVESGKYSAEEAIIGLTEKKPFSSLDKRFLRQLINGTVKMKRRLDHDIKYFLSKPSEKLPVRLQNILRLGFYQLFFTDRIPDAAAVSESVNLAKYFLDNSRSRLVNAVLRAAIRNPERVSFRNKEDDPAGYLADYYSYPDWFVKYCLNEFKFEDTEKLLEDMNSPPTISFRVNYLKAKPDEIENELKKAGIKFSGGRYLKDFYHLEEGGLPPQGLIDEGKIYIMDESAGMAVRVLNPRMEKTMLDMAAAPGGKALYAADKMRNDGMITAIDKSRKRLQLLLENSRRLGVNNINPVVADNLEFTSRPFDRVLLDAPCTGWGNAGRHSDLRWSKTEEDVQTLFKVQSMMLDRSAKMVKPGGILVYSTCTIIRKENDEVVEEFLARNKGFELESTEQFFDDKVVSERGFLKTYPNVEGLTGAFAARMKRIVKSKK